MQHFISTYVEELLELNKEYLEKASTETDRKLLVNNFSWGLVEELEEFSQATTKDEVLKEAGDVVAYAVLLLSMYHSPMTIVLMLYNISRYGVPKFINPFHTSWLGFYSNLKRINRENDTLNPSPVKQAVNDVIQSAASVHDITFSEILEANITKLVARKAKGLLYKGSGDNR